MTTQLTTAPIGSHAFGVLSPHSQSPHSAAAFLAAAPTLRTVPASPGAMHGAPSGPCLLLLLLALSLPGLWGLQVPPHTITQTEFYQKSLDGRHDAGEYMFDFDGDEIFHVENEETLWRLPEFQKFTSFEAQAALQNLAIDKQNLEISMAASNNSRIPIVPPEMVIFPKHPVEQDEPNILICYVQKFWPPVLAVSWLRNGAEVAQGVVETPFYPGPDYTFRKFSYLPFIPTPGDYYDCKVKHEGDDEGRKTHWEPQIPAPVSEAMETVICALGLAVGIFGIAAGTVLIIRGMKLGRARVERGML